MGRGRQKAKQAKVARKLKYQSYEPDLDALQRELSAKSERDYYAEGGDSFDPDGDDGGYSGYDDYDIPPATDI